MAYASIQGRSTPSKGAAAICDRCGFVFNHVDLSWQYDWRGVAVQNLRILVCRSCLDVPQEQLRAIVVPADPTPIINARTQDFLGSESDFRAISQPLVKDPVTGIPIPSTTLRVTEDCENRVLTPFGIPVGFDQNAVMPLNGTVHHGIPLSLLSVTSDGSATVTVTCGSAHGLQTDSQISVEGLSNNASNGFYSVIVLTATAFTYMTYGSNPKGSLLLPTSRIWR